MKMRALVIVALALFAVAVGAWMWFGSGATPPPVPDTPERSRSLETGQSSPANAVPASSTRTVLPTPDGESALPPKAATPAGPVRMTSSVMPGMPLVRTISKPDPRLDAAPAAGASAPVSRREDRVEGRVELESVQMMFRDFRTRLGENPVGSNAEIMRAVMGENPAKARLGPPEGQGVNERGELVDRWGTPYFFHQLAKDNMEVRSAGPDRVMWTPDDLVAK
ncbi:MAG: hypothetical protein ABMA01_05475 [Chthoniobacteraceae bacterium]